MQINRPHQPLAQRTAQGNSSSGVRGEGRTSTDSTAENSVRSLFRDLPRQGGESGGEGGHSGGLPFSNPMDDADTLMRAILANYVEQKPPPAELTFHAQPKSADEQALSAVKEKMQAQFKDNASNHDAFHTLMKKSFGESYDYAKAENIRQQSLQGDFSWMPEIKLVDAATLNSTSGQQGMAQGAYSKENDTIYLSRDLATSDPSKAAEVLTEEVGHALDARLNTSDAAGDEGRIFAILSGGGEISDAELNELRSENDSGTIVVDGKEVEVEFFIKKLFKKAKKAVKKVGRAIGKGIKKIGTTIKDGVSKAWDTVKKGFKKVMESKLFNNILMVAQFIPIPVVQIAVRAINIAKAAYGVYQGVKHGSIGMIAGGVR